MRSTLVHEIWSTLDKVIFGLLTKITHKYIGAGLCHILHPLDQRNQWVAIVKSCNHTLLQEYNWNVATPVYIQM